MLEQQRFSGDSADPAWAQEFREGDDQLNRQEEQIAHESNTITVVIARKTGRPRLFALEFRSSPPTALPTDANDAVHLIRPTPALA